MNIEIGKLYNYFIPIKYEGKRSDDIWICECIACGRKQIIGSYKLLSIEKESDRNGCNYCNNGTETDRIKYVVNGKRRSVYGAWYNMRRRCRDPKCPTYKYYGARGIDVFDEWYNSFKSFYLYVSKLEHFEEEGRSLDRIDNDKGYYPDNVRWATMSEQAMNRRKPIRRSKKHE